MDTYAAALAYQGLSGHFLFVLILLVLAGALGLQTSSTTKWRPTRSSWLIRVSSGSSRP
jgi:hypothetical protein